jgi:hypothetical protein
VLTCAMAVMISLESQLGDKVKMVVVQHEFRSVWLDSQASAWHLSRKCVGHLGHYPNGEGERF